MNLLAVHETTVQSLSQEDPLQKGMATHSSFLAWRVPWTEELGRLQFMGLQRVGLNWATHTQWVEKMCLQRAGYNWAMHTHECSPEQTPSALVGCKMLDTCTKWKYVVAKSWTQLSNTHTRMFPWADTFSPGGLQNVGHMHKVETCGCKELDMIEQHTHTHVPLWGGHFQTHTHTGLDTFRHTHMFPYEEDTFRQTDRNTHVHASGQLILSHLMKFTGVQWGGGVTDLLALGCYLLFVCKLGSH